jgi:hypothetical protein
MDKNHVQFDGYGAAKLAGSSFFRAVGHHLQPVYVERSAGHFWRLT